MQICLREVFCSSPTKKLVNVGISKIESRDTRILDNSDFIVDAYKPELTLSLALLIGLAFSRSIRIKASCTAFLILSTFNPLDLSSNKFIRTVDTSRKATLQVRNAAST